MKKKLNAYWWPSNNFGDTLTPIVLEWLTGEIPVHAPRTGREPLSVLGIGSILHVIGENDIVFGSGSNKPSRAIPWRMGVEFLAVRGPLSRKQLLESGYSNIPEVYGDPALLLPLIYDPRDKIEKTHKVGFLPHYVDKDIVLERYAENPDKEKHFKEKLIDIQADWKTVIEEVLSCEKIVASSLHGIIVAEAYGIPAVWEQYSEKIVGGDYKFQDYFLGTGRAEQKKGEVIPAIPNLIDIQEGLVNAFHRKSTE